MAYTKQCPECNERLSVSARACACGWSERAGKGGKFQSPCQLSDCTTTQDGDDGLCGYHRALKKGEFEKWRASGSDWRAELFAKFELRHQHDTWGALVRASHALETIEDKRDFLGMLMKMAVTKPLPYNPAQREAA